MANTSPGKVLLSSRTKRGSPQKRLASIFLLRLHEWQEGGDPRIWKLIISPEFGERLDLQRLTRDVMSRMETDLHTSLDWTAVAHFNTEHPHVHVALRGLDKTARNSSWIESTSGMVFAPSRNISPPYNWATGQSRTLLSRSGRQVPLQRFTPLDRLIVARTQPLDGISGDLRVTADPTRSGLGTIRGSPRAIAGVPVDDSPNDGARPPDGPHQWQVRRDLETALKAMKRAADNQKTLAAHGALLSDPRLQLSAPNWRDITSLEGRVLSHGEEEDGRRYLMLEGTDGRVYYLRYTPELDEARSRGDLTTNSFVVINKTVEEDRRRRIVVENLGNAETLFENRDYFRTLAKRLIEDGVNLSDDERWSGWLGQILREAPRIDVRSRRLEGEISQPRTESRTIDASTNRRAWCGEIATGTAQHGLRSEAVASG